MISKSTGRPGATFRFKALSDVIPAGGLYPVFWHREASAQIVVCILGVVTGGGKGGYRIYLHLATR